RWVSGAGSEAAAGELPELTRRERQIAQMVGQLLSDRDISTRLSLSVNTVKTHVKHVRRKLGVDSRRDVARALRTDLTLPSDLAHRHDWSGSNAAVQPE